MSRFRTPFNFRRRSEADGAHVFASEGFRRSTVARVGSHSGNYALRTHCLFSFL